MPLDAICVEAEGHLCIASQVRERRVVLVLVTQEASYDTDMTLSAANHVRMRAGTDDVVLVLQAATELARANLLVGADEQQVGAMVVLVPKGTQSRDAYIY